MRSNLCNESKYLLIESKNVHYKSRILNMLFQNKFCERRLLPSAFKQITQKCTLRSRNSCTYLHCWLWETGARESILHSTAWQWGSRRPGHAGLHTGQPHPSQHAVPGDFRQPRHTGEGSTSFGPTTVGASLYSTSPARISRFAARYRPSSLLVFTCIPYHFST